MNIKNIFFLLSLILVFCSCSSVKKASKINEYAVLETSEGSIIIGLYEATPKHKNNFIDNVNKQIYDSVLIYSVVPNGIIKMGLPQKTKEIDYLNQNYYESELSSETNPYLINKKGAVGMWRLPNEKNVNKFSDNKLFYICEGIQTSEEILKTLVAKRNAPLIADYITGLLKEPEYLHFEDSLNYYKTNEMKKEWAALYKHLTEKVVPRIEKDGKKLFKLNDFQKNTYTTIGGIPIYDYEYVVFGEVVKGMDVVETISKVKIGLFNKPKKDIFILSSKIISKKEFKKL
ncbi:MAG TPA: peptidylprolyl isomerase [Bacteroidales bacterium]|nr:peptidylprolyl isomerase [Bacteroidales bacterium]HOR59910.1 peptidylprolyl isomerase [Bacteroidales bacterium]HPL03957.1 peptidylprolyl isomerase [Bacteroidales bacterium]